MKKILIIIFLLSRISYAQQVSVTATCYNAVEEQCNEDFAHTATMFELDLKDPYKHRIIAISRDLESRGFDMRDKVLICGTGLYDGVWTIRDRMNARWESKIDFLVNECMPVGKWENITITKL